MSAEATVLFDVPGPKARRRHLIIAIISIIVLIGLVLLVLKALANPMNNQLTAEKWLPFIDPVTWTAYLLPGILATLKAAGLSVVLASVAGILLGMGRLSPFAPLRWVCSVFVEFFRSVPVLLMMIFAYNFGLFALQMSGNILSFFGVVVGLTFYNSCVIAELIRSGVSSLPKGQGEAGLAVGMSPGQTMVAILLPQAITAMLPSLVSQLVVILKDTALGYIISFTEVIRQGQTFASAKGNLIPVFIVLAALFILMNYTLTRIARFLEQRMQTSHRGPKTPPADPMLNPASVAGTAANGAQRQNGPAG